MSALLGMLGGGTPSPAWRAGPLLGRLARTVAVPEAGARMSMPGAASLCLESKNGSGAVDLSGSAVRGGVCTAQD